MIWDIKDDNLTITLTQDFVEELRGIIQKEREIHKEASAFYESLDKRLSENHGKLEELEEKLKLELQSQSQTCI